MRSLILSALIYCVSTVCCIGAEPSGPEAAQVNSVGMKMVPVKPGSFRMGSTSGDWDESPAGDVTISRQFRMSATEVTNGQYEQYDPAHKKLRGKLGFSQEDNEAVVFVSWHDAVAFCRWLSEKEGKPYRLPTEAEWEYACRAGTTTPYWTGETLPDAFQKNGVESWYPGKVTEGDIVSLEVGSTRPNPWGLYEMHGNVEEWCLDWYGPYASGPQTDPVGAETGSYRVTRGGSHSTTSEYLRSSNRLGTLPEDKSWLIGFRVVEGEMPASPPSPPTETPLNARDVSQEVPKDLKNGPDPGKPYFHGPRVYVKVPEAESCPMYNRHNHCPAIVNCPNGDLLAIWYTCAREPGRELGIVASRLPYGEEEWQVASPFWDTPDRNDHASALWVDEKGTLYHFNGLGVAATWGALATVMRTSNDNGATWSKARLIMPEHGVHHMPIESVIRTQEGAILVPCDAVPGGNGGSALLVSRDNGATWYDPGEGRPDPEFTAGSTGAWIAGIHAGFVQRRDGPLMAFGRGNTIDDHMPMSLSRDLGENWTYSASPFPPIGTGQRLVVLRLQEGPILLCSFAREARFRDAAGNEQVGSGLFAALSEDEGKSWEIKRLITDDGPMRRVDGGGNTGKFTMGPLSAEPRGYFSICQAANGVIHLISSKQHYAFNLAWLRTPPPVPPEPAELEVKATLDTVYRPRSYPTKDGWRWNGTKAKEADAVQILADGGMRIQTGAGERVRWVGEEDGPLALDDAARGYTAEITMQVTRSTSNSRGIDFEVCCPLVGRVFLTVTSSAVLWNEGGFQTLVDEVDNASQPHTYRVAASVDGRVQIFRDGECIGVRRAVSGRDRMAAARGGYLQWGEGAGASEADAIVYGLALDLTGAYLPEAAAAKKGSKR